MAVLGFGASFRDVREWYTRIALLDRQTCLFEQRDGLPRGTAFLVGPDLALTTAHLFNQTGNIRSHDGREVVARFGYAVSPQTGEVFDGVRYGLATNDWLLGHSPIDKADVALVRLEVDVGNQKVDDADQVRGWVDLQQANDTPREGSALAILQYAEGGPLKVAMNTDAIIGMDPEKSRLLYRTDTLPGASGAPCFDIDWRFVAMHQGRFFQKGNHNQGIPFAVIRDWLQASDLWPLATQKPPRILKVGVGESGLPQHTPFGLDSDLRKVLWQLGESQRLELKEKATEQDQPTSKIRIARRLLNSVAAFMNSRDGGTVLIGITDEKKFVGIEDEYARVNSQRRDWDGFALWLVNTLTKQLQIPAAFEYFSVVRYHESGKDICAVHVRAAASPVFVGDDFYVRVGNQNQPQTRHDLLAYVVGRWSWLGTRLQPTQTPALTS